MRWFSIPHGALLTSHLFVYVSPLLLPPTLDFRTSVASNSTNTTISSLSADPDKVWTLAVRKGTELYRQLRIGCSPNRNDPADLEQLIEDGYSVKGWPPQPRTYGAETMTDFEKKELGFPDGKNYYNIDLGARKKPAMPWDRCDSYLNDYCPQSGIIFAVCLNRLKEYHWSDVTMAVWKSLIRRVGGDVKNLKYVVQDNILNDIAHSIVGPEKPEGHIQTFYPGDAGFFALLGSPNGYGTVYLLIQHKATLGLKTISKAYVFWTSHAEETNSDPEETFVLRPNIIFEIADASFLGAPNVFNVSSGDHGIGCGSLDITAQ